MGGRCVREEFGVVPAHVDQVLVRMRDGVRLATDVYLPSGGGPAPAVIVRLPYDKAGALCYMPYIAEYLADRGYAVVLQDVRGKIRSEGETFAFVHELADGYDTIEWAAAQSWCNGTVGMYGDSYYGFTQWAAAASRHPALRAIVPRLTGSDIASVWMYPGGAFRLATMAWWGAYTWVDEYLYDFDMDWSVRPFRELVPSWLGGRSSPSLEAWIACGPQADFWTRDIYKGDLPNRVLDVPALLIGGWWDPFQRGPIGDWLVARAHSRQPQHLIMDAIDHFDDLLLPDGETNPDMYESPEAMRAFLPRCLDPAVDFFDRHLRGRPGEPLPPMRWRLVDVEWREASEWPPAEARPLDLHLTNAGAAQTGVEGGGLAPRPDRARITVRWVHDPDDLVPSLDEDEWRPLLGLPDERAVEGRDDVLTFTGEPLSRPLDVAGPVTARMRVASSGPSMHVIAKLVDVFPSGRARRVCEGAALVAAARRESEVVVDLGHAGYRFATRHALRLEIASSCFPRYLPLPGTGEDPWTAERTKRNEQSLFSGGDSPPCLRLFVFGQAEG